VNKAWTALWWVKKYFNDAIVTQKEGANYISKSNYKFGYYKYQYAFDSLNKMGDYLVELDQHLTKARSISNG